MVEQFENSSRNFSILLFVIRVILLHPSPSWFNLTAILLMIKITQNTMIVLLLRGARLHPVISVHMCTSKFMMI